MNLKSLKPSFNAKVDIEYKLFEITLFLTAIIFLIWLVIALLADYILQIQVTYFVCLILYSGLYVAFKQKVSFKSIATIYYTSALVLVIYSWFPSGGVSGVILFMLVLIYMSGLLVLPIKGFFFFIIVSLITLISFSIMELLDISSALSYMSDFDRIRDFSIAGFITLTTLGYTMYIFKKAYLQDRIQLKETIIALEKETKKAQSADKAKSDFLATISHEMRTPLNGIVGITDLIKETSLDKDQEYLVSNLSYSSELLHSLISDILDVTLIESGELNLHNDLININEEIEKLVEVVRPRILKKGNKIDVKIEVGESTPKQVIGDLLRFRQVLLNLINNAIKFTDEGFIKISSFLISEDEDTIKVKFVIEDSGIGISVEGQQKLFNRFYKGSGDSNIEGTGLGLSISRNLVTLMGGEINFNSIERKGSTFFFELPFKKFDGKVDSSDVDEELKNKPLQEVKILIAEDVRINQIVLKRLVESLGLSNIEIAENGEEAIQKVKESWYDVILMDIQMPLMDGLEASKYISEIYIGRKKPIILAVTANVFSIDQENYRKAGINGTLSKPVTKESLREILNKFI